jgi:vacuolar-type H+-ATPase subunit H
MNVHEEYLKDKVKYQEAKIKKLEAEFKMITDDRDERVRELYEANDENQKLREAIEFVDNWCKAYPLKNFPEPDFKKAHKILKEHGMTIDAISASNMRHVVKRVREELQKALEDK